MRSISARRAVLTCVFLFFFICAGADINSQTEETQETALTLACCGGFLEVADFLIKAGADLELGASTPLMEASQEGHLELVRYMLEAGASVAAITGICVEYIFIYFRFNFINTYTTQVPVIPR